MPGNLFSHRKVKPEHQYWTYLKYHQDQGHHYWCQCRSAPVCPVINFCSENLVIVSIVTPSGRNGKLLCRPETFQSVHSNEKIIIRENQSWFFQYPNHIWRLWGSLYKKKKEHGNIKKRYFCCC